MGLPALVLVHGGGFAADCWEPTIDVIRILEPELKVLTVDLPGRGNKGGDLITACIDGWVDSVVSDIENAALDDLVIASFTTGPGSETLPIRIYSEVRLGVKPEINAISAMVIGLIAVVIVVASAWAWRNVAAVVSSA